MGGVRYSQQWEQPHVGIVFRLTALRYEDRDSNRFDFTRVIGDVKAYIPLGPKSRVLAIRVRAQHSDPDDGHDVPFYLMETVGGRSRSEVSVSGGFAIGGIS